MSLFSSLRSASEALRVFDRSLEVVQNNVANASTPGYARQIQDVVSLPFDPALGLSGGVRSLGLSSSRNQYAEVAVRRQVTQEGFFDQKQASLGAIEPSFDVSGKAGIAAALSKLTQSFSSWSVNSNDPVARRTVLDRAQDLAGTFNAAANALAQTSADMQSQIRGTVDQINTLAGRLRDLNAARQSAQNTDAGLDANVQATLEELSELVGIQAIQQPDGSYTVLLGGQSPLVVGENQYLIGADVSVPQDPPPANPAGPPTARVLDAFGVDITGQVDGGRLAGLLEVHNGTLAGLIGDSSQPGDLNRMASALADRINSLLTAGQISDGPPPEPGVALFQYDTTNPTRAAATLSLAQDAAPDRLAAIDAGPPYVSNGTALKLAALAQPRSDADRIDGVSFTEFYGGMAARVGSETVDAQQSLDVQRQLVSQARDYRQQISGVSLDEEAERVIEYQRSYQAAAKMVSVLDGLTQTLIDMVSR